MAASKPETKQFKTKQFKMNQFKMNQFKMNQFIINPFRKKISSGVFSAIVSVVTLLMFHFPFFRVVTENVESGFNGVVIVVSLALLMLAINFFACSLLLYLCRFAGKLILALSFIGNAVTLYFINTYDVLVDDTMMGNVFNTNFSEATLYWSGSALLYILLLGVIPAAVILLVRLDYGSFKTLLVRSGLSLALALVIGFGNITNWPWVDNNSTVAGSLLMPWSYVVNAIRYQSARHKAEKEEILLPDVSNLSEEKDVVVLVIGESARRGNFSLYGYPRNTNPELAKVDGLKLYNARSNATYTTAGVKAILDYKDTDKLYEILPNYLYRNGVDVCWRSSNWGQSTLRVGTYQDNVALAALSESAGQQDVNPAYDEVLLYGLKEYIQSSDSSKVLVVLHTSTSHGPDYNTRYPSEYRAFLPVSSSVEMSKVPREEILNSYDNSILYTDHILSRIINELKEIEDRKCCMIYISDHGESLGENNLYMHGVPISIAPREQVEIPFVVWSSDPEQEYRDFAEIDQHFVFHSVMHFLGVDSPVYNPDFDIFK